jgi:hypothetical protein
LKGMEKVIMLAENTKTGKGVRGVGGLMGKRGGRNVRGQGARSGGYVGDHGGYGRGGEL